MRTISTNVNYRPGWGHLFFVKRYAACRRGFTLIEILLAISILAIVVSMVMVSFDNIFSNADHINIGSDILALGNNALDRITMDLNALYVMAYPRYTPPDFDDDPDIYRLVGQTRNLAGEVFGWLRFTSLAHLPFNQMISEGIAEIVYYVEQTEEGQFILRRSDTLFPYPEEFEESPDDPVVCEQVREFRLTFYDQEGDELEEWDTEEYDLEFGTPRAIGIKLTIGDEESSFVFSTQVALPVHRYRPIKR